MPIDVTVPASGESVTSANVGMWHVSNGSQVEAGQALVTLETDKVSNELEAPATGIVEILVAEDNEVGIGTVIARIKETAGVAAQASPATTASPACPAPEPAASAPALESSPSPAAEPAPAPAPAAADGGVVDIVVPPAGESISSASVAMWQKKDGEAVQAGETVVTLETDKVSNEVESPVSGTMRIVVAEGEEVPIGTVIARIEAVDSAQASTDPVASLQTAPISAAAPVSTPSPVTEQAPSIAPVAAKAPAPVAVATGAPVETKVDFSLPPVKSSY